MNEEREVLKSQATATTVNKKAFNLKKEPILITSDASARNLMARAIYSYQIEGKSEDYYPNLTRMAKMYIEVSKRIKEQSEMKAVIKEEVQAVWKKVNDSLLRVIENIQPILKGEDFKKFEEVFKSELHEVYANVSSHEDVVTESLGRIYCFNPTLSLDEGDYFTPEWKRNSAMGFIEELPEYEFKNLMAQLESEGFAKVTWHKYMDNEPSEK